MLLQSERESHTERIAEFADSPSLLIDREIMAAEATIRNVANSHSIRADDCAGRHPLLPATRTSPLGWTPIVDYAGSGVMTTLVPYGTPLAKNSGKWAAKIYDDQKTAAAVACAGRHRNTVVVGVLGLGLSIAKGLRHLHDGSIGAHSEGLGRGSVFRVCLSLAHAEMAALAQAPPAITWRVQAPMALRANAVSSENRPSIPVSR